MRLFNLYKLDFRLFGYSPDIYLQVAKGPLEKGPVQDFMDTIDAPPSFFDSVIIDFREDETGEKSTNQGNKIGVELLRFSNSQQQMRIKNFNSQFVIRDNLSN